MTSHTSTGSQVRSLLPRVLLATGALALALPTSAASAAPASHCDRLVVDHAGVLRDRAVREAARKVVSEAVDIRVLSYRHVPHGNLDRYINVERRRCGSWQGPDGAWKSNLVVLAVSVRDRASGLYYPHMFENEVGSRWSRVQRRLMNPRFSRGNYTSGMVAALERVAVLVEPRGRRLPRTEPHPASPSPMPTPARPQATEPSGEPSSTSWDVPAWAIALPLGAGGLGGLTWAGVGARRRLHRRAAARAGALAAAETMAADFRALSEAEELTRARVDALPRVEDVKVSAIRARFGATAAQVAAVTATCLQLAEQYNARTLTQVSAGDATVAEHAMSTTAGTMRHLAEDLQKVGAELDELEALQDRLPQQIASIRETGKELDRLLAERRSQGFLIDPYVERLPAIARGLAESKGLLARLRAGDAGVVAARAAVAAEELRSAIEALPARRERLRDDLAGLREALKQGELRLCDALVLADQLEEARHPSCTADVRALVTDAKAKLDGLPSRLDRIDRASSMSVQDFAAAEESAVRARQIVAEIEAACQAPVRRREELKSLDTSLPRTCEVVTRKLKQLEQEVAGHREAASFLGASVRLDRLARSLEKVVTELERPRSRLLLLAEELERLETEMAGEQDRLLAGIREYEEVEGLLRIARARVSSATASTDRPQAGFEARGLADDALDLLHEAESASDLKTRRQKAESAVAAAKEAEQALAPRRAGDDTPRPRPA